MVWAYCDLAGNVTLEQQISTFCILHFLVCCHTFLGSRLTNYIIEVDDCYFHRYIPIESSFICTPWRGARWHFTVRNTHTPLLVWISSWFPPSAILGDTWSDFSEMHSTMVMHSIHTAYMLSHSLWFRVYIEPPVLFHYLPNIPSSPQYTLSICIIFNAVILLSLLHNLYCQRLVKICLW